MVKTRSTFSRQPPTDEMPLEHPSPVAHRDTDMNETTDLGMDLDMQNSDELIMQEMERVTPRLEPDSYWDGRKRYDLLEEIGDTQDDMFHGSMGDDASRVASKWEYKTANIASAVAYNAPSKLPTKPVLKSTSSHRATPKSLSSDSACISHLATVFCDPHDRQRLPSNCNSVVRPQFSYADSNSARRRLNFSRRSSSYEAKTWAAPQDYEIINTSHHRVAWDDYEVWQRLCDEEEWELAEEEASERATRVADANNDCDGGSCAATTSEKQEHDEEGSKEGGCEDVDGESSSGDIEKVSAESKLEDALVVSPIARPCSPPNAQFSEKPSR